MAGVSIRTTFVKMASFSTVRGNCARSRPQRCRKTSGRATTSTTFSSVARCAQMLVIAHAAYMMHVGWSSVRLKMEISCSTKSRRRCSDADGLAMTWTSANKALPRVLLALSVLSKLRQITPRNASIGGSVGPVSYDSA